jgi:hypothetical protein
MNTDNIKIETIKDYVPNNKLDIKWCKNALIEAKESTYFPKRYSKLIRKQLLQGIKIKNRETGNQAFRRFDYSIKYIQSVMNPGINQWNKWVILCASEFTFDEFEDITNLFILKDYKSKPQKKRSIIKEISPKDHLIKRHKLSAFILKSKN